MEENTKSTIFKKKKKYKNSQFHSFINFHWSQKSNIFFLFLGNYLSVNVPQRARSAEMILLVPEDEEGRRASFELYKKGIQQRRRLPDIEQFKEVCFVLYKTVLCSIFNINGTH